MPEPLAISTPTEMPPEMPPEDVSHPWVPVDACTLPTAEQPLRAAELDALFAEMLIGVDQASRSEAVFQLAGGPAQAERARTLTDKETECCSFFAFTVTQTGPDSVELAVTVPDERTDVLAAL